MIVVAERKRKNKESDEEIVYCGNWKQVRWIAIIEKMLLQLESQYMSR